MSPASDLYDYRFIQAKMEVIWECKKLKTLPDMQDLAKTLAMRNLAGIHNNKLFKRCRLAAANVS